MESVSLPSQRSGSARTKTILIADDNEVVRRAARKVLENAGFRVCAEACDGVEAVEKASQLQPDVVILDVRMPKMNGIEASMILKRRMPMTPILLLSLYRLGAAVVSAVGATALLEKPDDIKNLPEHVKNLFEPRSTINTFVITKS